MAVAYDSCPGIPRTSIGEFCLSNCPTSHDPRGAGRGTVEFGLVALEIMSGIRAVERFVAEREVGDDVALDDGFQQRPLEPGGIAQMAARNVSAIEAQPDQHVAAERLDESEALAHTCAGGIDLDVDRSGGKTAGDLLDQAQALLDLADADPHPGVDVAAVEHGYLELQLVVGRIARFLARVERATAG